MRDPPRPWLWPRHTTHDGTRSDRRGGWTRRETDGRRSRGRGRMRTRGFRKCASSIRLEKCCCVSTAAWRLSMTRPGLLCVPQSRNFGRTDPDPKAGLIANEPRCANTERARVCATQNARFKYEVTFVRLLGRGAPMCTPARHTRTAASHRPTASARITVSSPRPAPLAAASTRRKRRFFSSWRQPPNPMN